MRPPEKNPKGFFGLQDYDVSPNVMNPLELGQFGHNPLESNISVPFKRMIHIEKIPKV